MSGRILLPDVIELQKEQRERERENENTYASVIHYRGTGKRAEKQT